MDLLDVINVKVEARESSEGIRVEKPYLLKEVQIIQIVHS